LCLGSAGGALFDYYVLVFGSAQDAAILRRVLAGEEEKTFNPSTMLKTYAPRFWFHAAQSLYHVNRLCSLPLLHVAMQMEFRGLSRIGRSLGALYGAFPPIRSYDRKKRKLTVEYIEEVARCVNANTGVLTFDNYCHAYGSPTLSVDRKGSYIKANYTVVAVSKYVSVEPIDVKFRYIAPEMLCVASMPRDPQDLLVFERQVASTTCLLFVPCFTLVFLGSERSDQCFSCWE
jgi:hypothetical protein